MLNGTNSTSHGTPFSTMAICALAPNMLSEPEQSFIVVSHCGLWCLAALSDLIDLRAAAEVSPNARARRPGRPSR
jgi:hypothetical protein